MRPPNSIKKNLQNESNLVAIAQAIVFFLLFQSKMQAQKNWKKKLSVQMPTKKFRNEIIIACLTLHYVIMVCTAIFVNKNFTLGWVHDRPFAVCTPFRSVRRRLKYPVVWL